MKPIVKQESEGKLVIIQRGVGFKVEGLFFQAIQEAILDGYKLPKSPELLDDFSFRNYQGMATGKCVLFAEGKDPSDAKPKPEVVAPVVEPVVVKEEPIVAEPEKEVVAEVVAPIKENKKAGRPSKKNT